MVRTEQSLSKPAGLLWSTLQVVITIPRQTKLLHCLGSDGVLESGAECWLLGDSQALNCPWHRYRQAVRNTGISYISLQFLLTSQSSSIVFNTGHFPLHCYTHLLP